MNSPNSESVNPPREVRYSVQKMLDELGSFDQVAHAAWPALPPQPSAPRQATSRSAAHIFAQELRNYATPAHVAALLKADMVGAASFLLVARELLASENPRSKVAIDIESHQETTEFGHLFAFVDSRLLNMLHTNPALYNAPLRQ